MKKNIENIEKIVWEITLQDAKVLIDLMSQAPLGSVYNTHESLKNALNDYAESKKVEEVRKEEQEKG